MNLSGCVTARIEDNRIGNTGISEGEGIVILAKSYHLGNDTETDFIKCVSSNVSSGSSSIRVVPTNEFKNTLFPWFEPRTAPSDTDGLARLLSRSKVSNMISNEGIKYIELRISFGFKFFRFSICISDIFLSKGFLINLERESFLKKMEIVKKIAAIKIKFRI